MSVSAQQVSAGGGGVARDATDTTIRGGDGAHSAMRNAVSGSTAGELSLVQRSFAGGAGRGSNPQLDGVAGAALSELDATNPGGGDLSVETFAFGGSFRSRSRSAVPAFDGLAGGDARSVAIGRTAKHTTAAAHAQAGASQSVRLAGRAEAIAVAEGVSGEARADARASGTAGNFKAYSLTPVGGEARSLARVADAATAATAAPPDDFGSWSTITVDPDRAALAAALDEGSFLREEIDRRAPLASISLGGAHHQATTDSLTLTSGIDVILFGDDFESSNRLTLGLYGGSGHDVENLVVEILVNHASVREWTFTDTDEATRFFDDQLLDLSEYVTIGENLSLQMLLSLTAPSDAAFSAGVLIWTPEPGTGVLLAVGLLFLAGAPRGPFSGFLRVGAPAISRRWSARRI